MQTRNRVGSKNMTSSSRAVWTLSMLNISLPDADFVSFAYDSGSMFACTSWSVKWKIICMFCKCFISSEIKVPAHDRFHALAAKVPPSLILPVSYGALLEIFNCTEIIISRLHNRSEICTFNKLKMGVEQMTKK